MTKFELYKELGKLTKDKEEWKENIPYVSSLLESKSLKIKAKALWLLGEMGLSFPHEIKTHVPAIASFCGNEESILRARSVNALGRIGRAEYDLIEPFWIELFRLASDSESEVRLSFVWASENIAMNTPDPYERYMSVFASLLQDTNERVRTEAPEFFRVLGRRRPEYVKPYIELLRYISETDSNRVVRIHCIGAVKATGCEHLSEGR